eukprot:CAMPEP_0172208936 /NCGR_PEP_ID=MMETSP1050-20130122/34795_1 /TAXON_ID=233186 /ORGANISM="Cryptomonas curvata, Strain CCAP979/52" /LENGTH=560 /DNA_ID=CAMNT_0012888675 /DNA_START=1 /DNA_END=1683 /DNA_ORIENTATION=-
MLGITRQHGFVLGSERAPIWRRREDITFMQMSFMEAAGRLALFQDFDVTLFDNFCVCVKSSSRTEWRESRVHYDRLCEWLLEISKECLSPKESCVSIQKPKTLLEGLLASRSARKIKRLSLVASSTSSEGGAHTESARPGPSLASAPASRKVFNMGEVVTAHALTKARLDYSELQAGHQRLREERFKFFTDKVAKVKLWRDDEGVLFERLKVLTQDLMAEIADLCDARYASLCYEAMGQELVAYSDVFDLGSKVCSILDSSAHEQLCSAPAALDQGIYREKDISEGQTYFNGIYPMPNRVGFKVLFRQDNKQVGAVRVDPASVQEAVVGMARQREAQQSLTPSPTICEDIFVSQLASRAALLNDAFQEAVAGVIRRHSAVLNDSGYTGEPSAVIEGVQLKCDHSLRVSTIFCCEFTQGMGFVEVHPAPVKTVTRMRTKLTEYAPPHPSSIWPLCANIMDPVRATIVCSSPAEILQVAGWFSNHEDETSLIVCRVKNKFSANTHVTDGYRDFQMCVVFTDANGLRIIGEIQVHDKQLHDLNLRMHKMYKIKRAQSPESVSV